jgi:hypothetical protein
MQTAVRWTALMTPVIIVATLSAIGGHFTVIGSMHTGRSFHTATLLADGKVLLAGGYNNGVTATAEVFDPVNATFTPAGSLNAPGYLQTATLLEDGRVLVAGGYNPSAGGTQGSAEIFSPVSGTFTPIASMHSVRTGHSATRLADGRVLLAAGDTNVETIASAEIFDPLSATFSTIASLNAPRAYYTATLLADGRVFLAGGWSNVYGYLASAEIFDPASESFTTTGSLSVARGQHSATRLADGRVLLAGGFQNGDIAMPDAEIFDSATGTFTMTTGPLNVARGGHTSTLLSTGEVLLTGGFSTNRQDLHSTAEIFDPATGTFTGTGSLNAGRAYHAETLLADGKVLLTGGTNNVAGLASAELFELSAPVDHTAPSVTCGSPDGLWHATNVAVTCTASDAGSALANGADASFALSTAVPSGTETANAQTNSRTVCDLAGNCVTAGPINGNMIDRRAPTATISAPARLTYLLNQTALANYGCTDSGSGVSTCAGIVQNATGFDTTTVGGHAFAVTATDAVGNTWTTNQTYTVAYNQCVLFDQTKAHKAGSTIPIKLELCDAAGANVSSVTVPLVATGVYLVSTTAPGPLVDSGNANPDSQFRFAGGSYIFNLSLKDFAQGTYALTFTAGNDPTTHAVQFQVR